MHLVDDLTGDLHVAFDLRMAADADGGAAPDARLHVSEKLPLAAHHPLLPGAALAAERGGADLGAGEVLWVVPVDVEAQVVVGVDHFVGDCVFDVVSVAELVLAEEDAEARVEAAGLGRQRIESRERWPLTSATWSDMKRTIGPFDRRFVKERLVEDEGGHTVLEKPVAVVLAALAEGVSVVVADVAAVLVFERGRHAIAGRTLASEVGASWARLAVPSAWSLDGVEISLLDDVDMSIRLVVERSPTKTAAVADVRSARQLTIVIKLGTSSICDEKTHEPLISNLSLLVETVVRLRRDGHRVILVSSGAIGIGLRKLDLEKRPKLLAKCQAIAAIGQCELLALWDKLFAQLRQPVAQILLTRNDIVDRTQYLNAANTFTELLNMGVVPIVNENDTLAVSEIKFGDNDTLSAITAGMVNADYLFLMTDVDCLYDKNPRTNADAKPIMVVEDISSLQADVSGAGSAVGTGGMSTKLVAAKLATSAGVTTIITRSSVPSNIFHIVKYCQSLKSLSQTQTPARTSSPGPVTRHLTPQSTDDPVSTGLLAAATRLEATTISTPETSASSNVVAFAESATPPTAVAPAKVPLHTRFLARRKDVRVRDRHFWLLHGLQPHGTLYIDQGAYNALTRSNRAGLLPVGIVDVSGEFHQLEAVRLTVVQLNNTTTTTKDTDAPPETESSGGSSNGSVSGSTSGGEEAGYSIVMRDVGRAIVNYSSGEILRIKGVQSSEIAAVLGYADTEYISHRDNTAFFKLEKGVSNLQTAKEGRGLYQRLAEVHRLLDLLYVRLVAALINKHPRPPTASHPPRPTQPMDEVDTGIRHIIQHYVAHILRIHTATREVRRHENLHAAPPDGSRRFRRVLLRRFFIAREALEHAPRVAVAVDLHGVEPLFGEEGGQRRCCLALVDEDDDALTVSWLRCILCDVVQQRCAREHFITAVGVAFHVYDLHRDAARDGVQVRGDETARVGEFPGDASSDFGIVAEQRTSVSRLTARGMMADVSGEKERSNRLSASSMTMWDVRASMSGFASVMRSIMKGVPTMMSSGADRPKRRLRITAPVKSREIISDRSLTLYESFLISMPTCRTSSLVGTRITANGWLIEGPYATAVGQVEVACGGAVAVGVFALFGFFFAGEFSPFERVHEREDARVFPEPVSAATRYVWKVSLKGASSSAGVGGGVWAAAAFLRLSRLLEFGDDEGLDGRGLDLVEALEAVFVQRLDRLREEAEAVEGAEALLGGVRDLAGARGDVVEGGDLLHLGEAAGGRAGEGGALGLFRVDLVGEGAARGTFGVDVAVPVAVSSGVEV
ncbi:LOW QUALITY PROTEIN: hypothetical protein Dda_1774 [Drechslerella dactyloides]|uniref:PUA domain-containing protein n=1 Tax=Drechslerella dactyloides TaxID=74499 RepID=A0AAD6NNC9_DREDA|nr:LOW QUALITY PROTEIN: hypothetical protein Dda_1774 [Drechslerella dactyloides]